MPHIVRNALVALVLTLAVVPVAARAKDPTIGTMTFGAPAAFGALGITGVSFGATNPFVDFGGGGAGKLTLSEVSVTRYADAASPLLLQGIAQGRHYQTVVIVVGGGTTTYTLEDVTITSFQQSVGVDATESLTLHFSTLTLTAGANSASVQSTSAP